MATVSLATILQRLEQYDPVDAAKKVLQDNPEVVPNLIRAQLYFGFDGDGFRLAPYKSPYYAKKKNEQNPQAGLGNPDLYRTGQFYQGIDAETTSSGINVYSNDSKNADLTDRYGDEIFKLGDEAKQELVEDTLKPGMKEEFQRTIKIRMR